MKIIGAVKEEPPKALNPFKLKPHPFSEIFPSATGSDYDQLLASVKKQQKLRYPIIIYQNMILDGNQRIRACLEARVEPRYKIFEGTDEAALDIVWDLNAGRRQLTQSQKAIAAAKFTVFSENSGHVTTLSDEVRDTLGDAATKAGVSKKTIQRAKEVLEHGTNEQIEAVREGKKTVTEASLEIKAVDNSQDSNGKPVDDSGNLVPDSALPYWNRRPEARNVLNQISAARGQVKKLDPKDCMYSAVNINGVLSDLNAAYNRFAAAVPAHVCPYCKGVKPDGCKCCKGRGVISKFEMSMVPDEMKKKANQPF